LGKEKNFENRVKKFLKEHGCWFVKYWGGGEFTKAGVPDILACIGGQFVGIEVKSDTGRMSALQQHNLLSIDQEGGYGILLYPKDFDKFRLFCLFLKQGNFSKADALYVELKGRWK